MSDINSQTNRTLALAGVFQAAHLVQQMAQDGKADPQAMELSIRSLFTLDVESVVAIYEPLASIESGLELLSSQLANPKNPDLTRYVVSLLHHARALVKRNDLGEAIRSGLETTESRLSHFPPCHINILAGLADIYTQTISTIPPRIMVKGDPQKLNQPDVANAVRALLLAGIRSAVLWQQCGGSRLRLLLSRKGLVDEARRLLDEGLRSRGHC